MSAISAPVGAKGLNLRNDVVVVQRLLNRRAVAIGIDPVAEDGNCDAATIAAIRNFQLRIVGLKRADGRLAPDARATAMLADASAAALSRDKVKGDAARKRLSGAGWFAANQARFPFSTDVQKLKPGFAVHVQAFLDALRRAGAHVIVSSTWRSRTRGALMHYAWGIGYGTTLIADVPDIHGADILWDHGDVEATRAAALKMVELFRMKEQASLTSNHYDGEAIDMTIGWDGPITIFDAKGAAQRIDHPRSGATHPVLHAVGASYGVIKLTRRKDPPHWSIDGG